MPSWGLGNAAATLVGQNLGAGNPARAEQAVWRAAFYNLVFLGASGGLRWCWSATRSSACSRPTRRWSAEGGRCLRIVAAGFPFYAYGMVVTQAFNGAGDTRHADPDQPGLLLAGRDPARASLLARPLGLGPSGVYVAITLAFSPMAVVSVALFRRGRWKTVRV